MQFLYCLHNSYPLRKELGVTEFLRVKDCTAIANCAMAALGGGGRCTCVFVCLGSLVGLFSSCLTWVVYGGVWSWIQWLFTELCSNGLSTTVGSYSRVKLSLSITLLQFFIPSSPSLSSSLLSSQPGATARAHHWGGLPDSDTKVWQEEALCLKR